MLWLLFLLYVLGPRAWAMRPSRIAQLRGETVDMFYHGYDNYMKIAFPEDELRPLTCAPLTRDRQNPRNIELNDVLGNYSLTLIDSLSTLAILASAPPDERNTGAKALRDFQDGVVALVEQYGDGRPGSSGQGLRGRGFDVDSKVQVFETVIRGVGGLLSAHLFAVGELPITGYDPRRRHSAYGHGDEDVDLETHPIAWPNRFKYDGQLLRLALDLAQRLLPAFYTKTGMPYPRVNLRYGIPFYTNSPLHSPALSAPDGPPEITETCSAGAGSLVLEFTALSRLTGDPRFEQLAKRAFWAVWARKSDIGLIGGGVDAESGDWISPYAMIGAGVDSFFEYALKTHILLSGHELPNRTSAARNKDAKETWLDPNSIFSPLSDLENSPDSFLEAWRHSHAAIKRHLYSERDHPHYVNVNLWTGSLVSNWVDSLGAYYPGLLALAGEVDEAIETNLLYTAIWTRYAALPERWSIKDKTVEGGLGWWPLRPEFIESTYHLYRATKDPWYLYVGEMVLRDIKRRCWTPCGWAGLQNVLDGEKSDRMESFFLGETAKYLYLLLDDEHPLNSLDAAYVFTTEGHPLIIPKKPHQGGQKGGRTNPRRDLGVYYDEPNMETCPAPPQFTPLTGSNLAAREDLYHPSRMLDLHMIPDDRARLDAPEGTELADDEVQYSFFPWTLPVDLLPNNGTCAKVYQPFEVTLEFASNAQQAAGGSAFDFLVSQNLKRISLDSIRVGTTSGLKLTLRLEEGVENEWRVTRVNNIMLGKDEFLVMDRFILREISDPRFNLVRDPVVAKLVHVHQVDLPQNQTETEDMDSGGDQHVHVSRRDTEDGPEASPLAWEELEEGLTSATSRVSELGSLVKSLLSRMVASIDLQLPTATPLPGHGSIGLPLPYNLVVNMTAITSTGIGAAPLPPVDIPPGAHIPDFGPVPPTILPWATVFAAGDACHGVLPSEAPRDHQVLLIRRGGCSFSEKLANIPAYAPEARSLQLVVVVSDEDPHEGDNDYRTYALHMAGGGGVDANNGLIRPLLDEVQRTPAGIQRHHPIAMVMVGGGEVAYHQLAVAGRVGLARRYYIESSGVRIRNIIVDEGDAGMYM